MNTGAATAGQRAQPIETQRSRTGLVTLLFTDIVGSTGLKQHWGDRLSASLFAQHHQLVRETLTRFPTGQEIETAGDSFLIVFSAPSDAVLFALLLQARLRDWPSESGAPLRDRIGIHLGEVVIRTDQHGIKPQDLHGIQIDTCARVLSLGGGGQILMTRAVFDNARQVLKGEQTEGLGPLSWLNHGLYQLKGVEEPVEICEVGETGVALLSAPADSDKARRFELTEGEPVLGWRPALGQPVPNTNWVLEAKLGEGGFGEVWLGRHPTLKAERRVFKFCFRADRVRTLKREMTLFRLLKERVGEHPNIVSLRDVYFEAPPYYVEEEYAAGRDLRSWCQEQGGAHNVPLETKLEIVAQVADGLQAAHDAGIIHRDVKPANILVRSGRGPEAGSLPSAPPPSTSVPRPVSGSVVEVKLTDFGIGQVVSDESLRGMTRAGFTQTLLSSSSSQTGTQLYMAPELLAGKPASIRSDIYSLGVVLYQLLLGDFTQALTIDWARRIPDPLLREDLERCLSGEPTDRLAGAAQLAKSLRLYERRQTELAERERLAQQTLRRRRAARAAIAGTGVLVLVSLGLGYGFHQARQDRDWAELQAYVADMKTADVAIHTGNLGQAKELLRRHIPGAGGKDRRGIEWRCLWLRSQGEQVQTFTHAGEVTCADISPDGRWVVTECQRTFMLWDRKNEGWARPLGEGTGSGNGLAFSPDGRFLAASTSEGIVLWDVSTWQTVRTLPAAEAVPAFCGDGSVLAAFGADGIQAWSTADWQPRVRAGELVMPAGGHRSLALNRQGTLLAASIDKVGLDRSTQRDDVLAVWSLAERRWLIRETTGVVSPQALAFSANDRWLAVGAWPGTIHLWNLEGTNAATRLSAHQALATGVAFSPDSQTSFSSGADQLIRLWKTGGAESLGSLRGHLSEVTCLRISGDGRWLVSASKDSTARVWNASGQPQKSPSFAIPQERLLNGLSPDARRLFTTNPADWTFEEWDTARGERVRQVPLQHTNLFLSLSQMAQREGLRKSIQRSYLLFDWSGLNAPPSRRQPGRLCSASTYDTPWWALTASTEDGIALAWDRDSGSLSYSNKFGVGPVMFGKTRPDQERFLVAESLGGFRFRVYLWDMTRNREHVVLPTWRAGSPLAVVPNRDATLLAYPGSDGTIIVWDYLRSRVKRRLTVPLAADGRLEALAFSPDNTLLAVATGDRAQVWSIGTGRPATQPLSGHLSGVYKIGFSADSRTVMTYSQDRTVRLWNVATGREVMSGLPIDQVLSWHPRIGIFSKDETAAIEPEGEDRWRVVRLPTLAEVDRQELAQRDRLPLEPAQRAGTISKWLVLGPISYESGQPGSLALDQQQIPDESQLRPRVGKRVRVGERDLTWHIVDAKDGVLDLTGRGHDFSVSYAVCYLRAKAGRQGLILSIGSDDQAKVYLNGRPVFRWAEVRRFSFDQNTVDQIELRAGLNVLVFKMVNELHEWKGAIRITDPQDNPLPDLRVTTDP